MTLSWCWCFHYYTSKNDTLLAPLLFRPPSYIAMKFIAAAASTPPSSASFHHPTLCTPFPPLKHPGIANSVFQGVDFHSSSNTSQRLRRRNNNRNSRITAKNSDLRKHTGTWQSEHTSSSSNNTKNVPRNAKCNSADARKKRKLQHVVTSIQLPVLDQIRTRKHHAKHITKLPPHPPYTHIDTCI